MGAHHFFVTPTDVNEGIVEIAGGEAHHAARVLRVRPGEAITIADGSGRVMEAVVTDVGSSVRANVRVVREEKLAKPELTLYQAVAKGDRMDDVIAKAVEIGVRRIVPFVAERTIVRWDDAKRHKASRRWSTIARSAAKQCRAAHLTIVGDVQEGAGNVPEAGEPVFVLHERARARLRDALPADPPDAAGLVVGPEGGLSDAEVESLARKGAAVVSLGDRILRTETAGLVAAAVIGYVYGNLG